VTKQQTRERLLFLVGVNKTQAEIFGNQKLILSQDQENLMKEFLPAKKRGLLETLISNPRIGPSQEPQTFAAHVRRVFNARGGLQILETTMSRPARICQMRLGATNNFHLLTIIHQTAKTTKHNKTKQQNEVYCSP
jgi:hypothetical protein